MKGFKLNSSQVLGTLLNNVKTDAWLIMELNVAIHLLPWQHLLYDEIYFLRVLIYLHFPELRDSVQ